MRLFVVIVVCLLLPTAVNSSVEGSSFTVDQWDLVIAVHHEFPDIAGDSFQDVINPFEASHSVSLNPPAPHATSSATYQFSWTATTGTFAIEGSQESLDVDTGTLFSVSGTTILVATASDLLVEIDAAYSYDLPPDSMLTRLSVDIVQQEPLQTVYSMSRIDDTFSGFPASGTFIIGDQVLLPGGYAYFFRHQMLIQSFAGGTGLIGTGSGTVDFQLQVVPEPATLWLAVPGGPLLLPRVRRQRHPGIRQGLAVT